LKRRTFQNTILDARILPSIDLKISRLKFKMREVDTNEVEIRFSEELLKS